MMRNEFHTEPTDTPPSAETEADAQTAHLVTERLNAITKRAERARRLFLIRGFVLIPCLMFGLSLIAGFARMG